MVKRDLPLIVAGVSLFAASLMAQEPTIRRPENLPEPVSQPACSSV